MNARSFRNCPSSAARVCAINPIQPGHLGLALRRRTAGSSATRCPKAATSSAGVLSPRLRARSSTSTSRSRRSTRSLTTTSQEGLRARSDAQRDLQADHRRALRARVPRSATNYYDEVVGPEFRSAASGVFARHSYTELAANKEKIEDEIEHDVQRRIKGKHVAITSITLESIEYAPEIQTATRERIVGEQEASQACRDGAGSARRRLGERGAQAEAALEQETAQSRPDPEPAAEQELKLTHGSRGEEERARDRRGRRAAREGQGRRRRSRRRKADAEAMTILARAHAEENRAATQAISPLTVQMKAYEALGQLGGTGTTIMLGDFSQGPAVPVPARLRQRVLPELRCAR